jgi:hypothetical protein
VVWLCTEAAAHVSGQNFVVGGGTVQLVSGWRVESSIEQEARWTLPDLDGRWRDLFGDRPTALLERRLTTPPPATSTG